MMGLDNCAAHSVGRHLLSHGKTTDRSHDDDDVVTSLSADVWPTLIYHTMVISPPETHLLIAWTPKSSLPHTTHHSSILIHFYIQDGMGSFL
jgi:hypothetical protein